MLGGVGAGGELAFDRRPGQHVGVGDERADVALQQHQPFMNLVLIGGLVHLHGQIAVGDAGNISDQRVQPIVNAVDGIFHALMIAVAFDLHLLAEIAATDQAQNPVPLCDGQQNGVQHVVDAVDHSREIALEPVGLAAFVQLTGLGSLGQALKFGVYSLQVDAQRFDSVVDEGFLAGELFKLCLEIAFAELADAGHGLFLHRDVPEHHGIDARGHPAEIAGIFRGIDRGVDIALVVRGGHRVHVADQAVHAAGEAVDGLERLRPFSGKAGSVGALLQPPGPEGGDDPPQLLQALVVDAGLFRRSRFVHCDVLFAVVGCAESMSFRPVGSGYFFWLCARRRRFWGSSSSCHDRASSQP